ncbi:MAG: cytidylate kinase-like family protein [Lachnospiraceae bacterium]|nr:cytidylate kinase-like family protein [Lachnospiraceae bacterium]
MQELARKESCVIVGRLGNYILKDMPTAYHVFISADMAVEAERVAARDHMSPEAALAKVKKVNHERAVHCKHFTKTDWGNVKNYDLCIKSDDFGVEETAKIIADLFEKKMA